MARRPGFALQVLVLMLMVVAFILPLASTAEAGTQDFTLVNASGVDVFRLFISESATNDWEEDVLGDDVLLDGERIDVQFSGRDACLWDMMVTDADDDSLVWSGINLCQASVVVLHCNDEQCWAEIE